MTNSITKQEKKRILKDILGEVEKLCNQAIDEEFELDDPISEIRRALKYLEEDFKLEPVTLSVPCQRVDPPNILGNFIVRISSLFRSKERPLPRLPKHGESIEIHFGCGVNDIKSLPTPSKRVVS